MILYLFSHFRCDAIQTKPQKDSRFAQAKNYPRPRLIKTHLPMQLLPDKFWTANPKIVYVFRQPKDVVVSSFHQFKALDDYQGGFKEVVDCFVKDLLPWSPYHEHISGFIELSKIQENIHLIRYEDLKKDLTHEILRMAKFLETSIKNDDALKLADHLNFKNMRSLFEHFS